MERGRRRWGCGGSGLGRGGGRFGEEVDGEEVDVAVLSMAIIVCRFRYVVW